jgi:hypothetical protein
MPSENEKLVNCFFWLETEGGGTDSGDLKWSNHFTKKGQIFIENGNETSICFNVATILCVQHVCKII